jgi:hypothetical protein
MMASDIHHFFANETAPSTRRLPPTVRRMRPMMIALSEMRISIDNGRINNIHDYKENATKARKNPQGRICRFWY